MCISQCEKENRTVNTAQNRLRYILLEVDWEKKFPVEVQTGTRLSFLLLSKKAHRLPVITLRISL